MTYAEFRRWAWDAFGYRFRNEPNRIDSAWRRTVWGDPRFGRAGTGGFDAVYTEIQQRRFATWMRGRGLLAPRHLVRWLQQAEKYADGWLVNDGAGIRWVAEPEKEAHQLVARGFVAVRCGL